LSFLRKLRMLRVGGSSCIQTSSVWRTEPLGHCCMQLTGSTRESTHLLVQKHLDPKKPPPACRMPLSTVSPCRVWGYRDQVIQALAASRIMKSYPRMRKARQSRTFCFFRRSTIAKKSDVRSLEEMLTFSTGIAPVKPHATRVKHVTVYTDDGY
jgi:hypothetical protein